MKALWAQHSIIRKEVKPIVLAPRCHGAGVNVIALTIRGILQVSVTWMWRRNGSLTLANIPLNMFNYHLGHRSALKWIIDQYQISEDKRSGIKSNSNRSDDEEYIVRLVRQVVRFSLETVKIVNGLPAGFVPAGK